MEFFFQNKTQGLMLQSHNLGLTLYKVTYFFLCPVELKFPYNFFCRIFS